MIQPGDGVVAGVSGGADSVCLLYVLTEYQKQVEFSLTAVHVEHGIRGGESLRDAEFTRRLCQELQVPCRVVQADVRGMAKQQGLSLEEAGRAARYRIFEEIRQETGAKRIAVAHNQNDQAETVLLNLARGSGLKGLGGIRPVRGRVIRPLLFTSRETIQEILLKAGLSWRTDRTNLTLEYTRNRIRLSVLPEMERAINPKTAEHIAGTALQLQQVQTYIEQETCRAVKACVRQESRQGPGQMKQNQMKQDQGMQDIIICLDLFLELPELIRREVLRAALERRLGGLKDIGRVHVESLMGLAGMDCGKEIRLPGGVRAVREDGIIRLTGEPSKSLTNPGKQGGLYLDAPGVYHIPGWRLTTDIFDNNPELLDEIHSEKKYTKWLSYDTIKCGVLLRKRQTGDYLTVGPLGGRKKLKDYFIDLKIPRDQRDDLWLVADGPHVLWVPGYRISEAAKVRPETEKIIRIQMEEEFYAGENQDFDF